MIKRGGERERGLRQRKLRNGVKRILERVYSDLRKSWLVEVEQESSVPWAVNHLRVQVPFHYAGSTGV